MACPPATAFARKVRKGPWMFNWIFKGRSDSGGCEGRLRSRLGAKLINACRGTRRTLVFRLPTACSMADGPAGGVRGGSALSYSSERRRSSRRIQPIIFLHLLDRFAVAVADGVRYPEMADRYQKG